MKIAASVIGIFGVVLYISSYQFKNRKTIVAMYSVANLMYVLQYLMLGAYTGVAMDFLALISSVIARKKGTAFIQKHHILIMLGLDALMIVAGLIFYQNFSRNIIMFFSAVKKVIVSIVSVCVSFLWMLS